MTRYALARGAEPTVGGLILTNYPGERREVVTVESIDAAGLVTAHAASGHFVAFMHMHYDVVYELVDMPAKSEPDVVSAGQHAAELIADRDRLRAALRRIVEAEDNRRMGRESGVLFARIDDARGLLAGPVITETDAHEWASESDPR